MLFQVSPDDPLAGMTDWKCGTQHFPIEFLFGLQGYSLQQTWDRQVMQRGGDLMVDFPYSEARPTGIEFYWRSESDAAPASAQFNPATAQSNPATAQSNSATAQSNSATAQPNESATHAATIEWWVSANTRLLDESNAWSAVSQFHVAGVQLLDIDEHGRIESVSDCHWDHQEPGAIPIKIDLSPNDAAKPAGHPLDRQQAFLFQLSGGQGTLVIAGYPGDQSVAQISVLSRDSDARSFQVQVIHRLNFGFLEKGVIRRARFFALILPPQIGVLAEIEHHLHRFYHSPLPLTV